jgi:hypothetical protein
MSGIAQTQRRAAQPIQAPRHALLVAQLRRSAEGFQAIRLRRGNIAVLDGKISQVCQRQGNAACVG